MAVVKEIRLDNFIVRIHDDCFDDEESVKRRLDAVKKIIIEVYMRQYIKLNNIS